MFSKSNNKKVMAYFDEEEENPKAGRYKICMSGRDLGATLRAHMKAIGVNYSTGRVRATMSPAGVKKMFDAKDYESKTYFSKVVNIVHAFDHYFVYNIRRMGPFFPPPHMDRSADAVIRYVCRMRNIDLADLSSKTRIPETRLNRLMFVKSASVISLAVYEVSAIFEALGITMYIMPNMAAENKDLKVVLPKKKRSE
jgi:hypothetical protein